MALFTQSNVSIRALAAAVPMQRKKNIEFDLVSKAERELIIKTTGVSERRIADSDITSSDLCLEAAKALLSEQNICGEHIGLLLFVSQSPDYIMPATAPMLQHRLELPNSAISLDINQGCAGYVYGLAVAASLMNTCGIRYALLLCGETINHRIPETDKSTYPIFGSAGSATLLESSAEALPWHFSLKSDGKNQNAIIIPDGGARNPITEDSLTKLEVSPGITRNRLQLELNGPEIFAFSTKEVPDSVRELAAHYHQDINKIDYYVMHQANKILNETIRRKLAIPENKVPYSINEYGNTSSASIPLTMISRLKAPLESAPQKILMSGFGVGLSWGSVFMEMRQPACLPVIEVANRGTR